MNTLRNKVCLIGRLGAQPEIFNFDSGHTLARFSIATNENYKDKNGEWQENTQWHNITAWGKTAERMKKILDKGQEVIIEGKLVHKQYETKSGEKRFQTEVEAQDFLLVSGKNISTSEEVKIPEKSIK
jgi:single-strand DNA-binding protein